MATFSDVKTIRLKLHDPLGFINFVEVATLPVSPANQTAYSITDSGVYQEYKNGTWKTLKIEISDEQIKTYVDLYGVEKATVKVCKDVLIALGKEMRVESIDSGTESVKYQTLSATYSFYKSIIDSLEEDVDETAGVNTGVFVRTCHPPIGGVREPRHFTW
jgi:4-hydroxyphenylpyruvate dioxygenase-like putative hemolysin